MDKISDKIKAVRNLVGLTQEDFAHKIGLSRSNLALIETGKTKPTLDAISAICSIYKINSNFFHTEKANLSDYLTENVMLNVNSNVNNNTETTADSRQNEFNKQSLMEKAFAADGDEHSPELIRFLNTDPVGIKLRNLQDAKNSYEKRIKRDLQTDNQNLFKLYQVIENLSALMDELHDVFKVHRLSEPDPFFAYQYIENEDLKVKKVTYKEHKEDVIRWLESLNSIEEATEEFYTLADGYLKKLKPFYKEDLF